LDNQKEDGDDITTWTGLSWNEINNVCLDRSKWRVVVLAMK